MIFMSVALIDVVPGGNRIGAPRFKASDGRRSNQCEKYFACDGAGSIPPVEELPHRAREWSGREHPRDFQAVRAAPVAKKFFEQPLNKSFQPPLKGLTGWRTVVTS